MTAPIPATLPGLLRAGTGVLDVHGTRGVWVERIGDHGPGVAWETGDLVTEDPVDLVLDLDSATSRAHLAWWIRAQPGMSPSHPPADIAGHLVSEVRLVTHACLSGWPVSPAQFDILTTVARHLAGLETA